MLVAERDSLELNQGEDQKGVTEEHHRHVQGHPIEQVAQLVSHGFPGGGIALPGWIGGDGLVAHRRHVAAELAVASRVEHARLRCR